MPDRHVGERREAAAERAVDSVDFALKGDLDRLEFRAVQISDDVGQRVGRIRA